MIAKDEQYTGELLLKGEVIGVISTASIPYSGCRSVYIGSMLYRCVASPCFYEKYFKQGVNSASVNAAPAVVFDRDDSLHHDCLPQLLNIPSTTSPLFYVPSPEAFKKSIIHGLAYGLLPDADAGPMIQNNRLVDLSPRTFTERKLYWHSWATSPEKVSMIEKELQKRARNFLHITE